MGSIGCTSRPPLRLGPCPLTTYLTHEEIQRGVANLADQVVSTYGSIGGSPRPPPCLTVLAVLNGGLYFATDLTYALEARGFPHKLQSIRAASYQGRKAGTLRVWGESVPREDIEGCYVLVVDDIYDTGATMKAVTSFCTSHGALGVSSAVVVSKQWSDSAPAPTWALHQGCPGTPFLYGYGMDLDGANRALPEIREAHREE